MAGRADYAAARKQFATIDAASNVTWIDFFDSPNGFNVLGKLLGDAYGTVKDEEERRAGVKRTGASRRAPRRASLEEVLSTVFPERYSLEPFPAAMERILAGRSQRMFAKQCGLNQMALNRLMRGETQPDLATLEKIAKASKITPAYFREWRALYIVAVLAEVFSKRPNLSIAAIELLLESR